MDEQSKRKSYQTDMSDEEWNKIEPHVPKRKTKVGRKREHSFREILNAIFYIVRSGCVWRMMPHDSRHGRRFILTSAYGNAAEYGKV